jgi:hypothetical protein
MKTTRKTTGKQMAKRDYYVAVGPNSIPLLGSYILRGIARSADVAADEQCDKCGKPVLSSEAAARVIGDSLVCGCGARYAIREGEAA